MNYYDNYQLGMLNNTNNVLEEPWCDVQYGRTSTSVVHEQAFFP